MLLSMTGFGESHCHENGLAVSVEVRTINSRYFKLSVRASEGYASLEPHIEEVVRRAIHRGTIQVTLRVERLRAAEDYRINVDVLERYRNQLEELKRQWDLKKIFRLDALLPLPGVVNEESVVFHDAEADWPVIGRTLETALEHLGRMRAEEGRAMAADLAANCRSVAASLEQVESRSPQVVEDYRTRLHEKLQKILEKHAVSLDPSDLIKEVSLFADRADISEEIVRLRSHVEQFLAIMELPESSRPQARIPHPRDGPRGEYHRLEGQRRGNRPACDRNQNGHRTHPRDDSEHRVNPCLTKFRKSSDRLRPVGSGQDNRDARGVWHAPCRCCQCFGDYPAAQARRS